MIDTEKEIEMKYDRKKSLIEDMMKTEKILKKYLLPQKITV